MPGDEDSDLEQFERPPTPSTEEDVESVTTSGFSETSTEVRDLETVATPRSHWGLHFKELFPRFIHVDDPSVKLQPPNIRRCLIAKHFISGITPRKALEASFGREGRITMNTMYELPTKLMRVVYMDSDGHRVYRFVSPRPLKAYQCYFDKKFTNKWKVSYLGELYAVVQTDSHLDTKFVWESIAELKIDIYSSSRTYEEL